MATESPLEHKLQCENSAGRGDGKQKKGSEVKSRRKRKADDSSDKKTNENKSRKIKTLSNLENTKTEITTESQNCQVNSRTKTTNIGKRRPNNKALKRKVESDEKEVKEKDNPIIQQLINELKTDKETDDVLHYQSFGKIEINKKTEETVQCDNNKIKINSTMEKTNYLYKKLPLARYCNETVRDPSYHRLSKSSSVLVGYYECIRFLHMKSAYLSAKEFTTLKNDNGLMGGLLIVLQQYISTNGTRIFYFYRQIIHRVSLAENQ